MRGTNTLSLLNAFSREMASKDGEKLRHASSLEAAGVAAQQIINNLMDPEREALGDLQRRYGEQIRFLLGLVLQAAEMIRSASETTREKVEISADLTDVRLSVAGTAAVTAAVMLALPTSPVVAVIAASGGFAAGEAVRHSTRRQKNKTKITEVAVTRAKPEIVTRVLQAMLEKIQSYADQWILIPPQAERQFAEQEELIDLLHELLRTDGTPSDLPIPQANRIIKFLGRNGVEVKNYDGDVDGPAPDPLHWNVDRLGQGITTTTILPLLTQSGHVIRKGHLIQE